MKEIIDSGISCMNCDYATKRVNPKNIGEAEMVCQAQPPQTIGGVVVDPASATMAMVTETTFPRVNPKTDVCGFHTMLNSEADEEPEELEEPEEPEEVEGPKLVD